MSRARRRSRLAPDALKAAITLYPGRSDARVTCGAADEDGAFPVTIRHTIADLSPDGSAPFDVLLYAQVLESAPDHHEVMSIEAGRSGEDEAEALDAQLREMMEEAGMEPEPKPDPVISVTRHQFRPARRGGTVVEIAERGGSLPRGLALGFWLQDYMADYLTDEVDRAEGRAPRANRFGPQDHLIVDLGRAFLRRQGDGPAPG
jgi:hypothetical protein